MAQATKYLLDESRMPTHWYNIAADLPVPPASGFAATTDTERVPLRNDP